ncbi:paraplegin-like, partial [Ruditapes philippinarum]|uniref:paraplegin-like n=1 Tax=Ruditapes philippinarum TaxID=129788 RepID=UPI00295B63F7
KLGARPPTGALLLGPPGCGKTLLAKALASECDVPFYYMAATEFMDMFVGAGASKVRKLFQNARENAPCIIYIDEIDAIGRVRGQSNQSDEQLLNQLLTELDGMNERKDVIILASTNRADVLDKALLRPGRFDRHIMIDLPTLLERTELFELYLNKLKLKSPVSTYANKLAKLTPGMSGADISNICNEAAIHAARVGNTEVSASDFEFAIERIIAGELETKFWGFAQYFPKENQLYSNEQLFEMMCMALGGRVAESVIFNSITNGAQDDLTRVTKIAYAQIKTYGMSKTVGLLSFPLDDDMGIRPFSKKYQNMIDIEAQQLVGQAYRRTEKIIQENVDKLHKVANLLLEKETISASQIEELIGPPPFGKKNMIDPETLYDDEVAESLSPSKPKDTTKSV